MILNWQIGCRSQRKLTLFDFTILLYPCAIVLLNFMGVSVVYVVTSSSLVRYLKNYLRSSEGRYIYQEMSQKIKLIVKKSLLNVK